MKRIISLLLIICTVISSTYAVSAKEPEEYLSDMRIIYAESYDEAKKILQNTEFKKYKLLDYNLNNTATKVDIGITTIGDSDGVYLAYQTTTNVDDAITDVAIMQMDGGYKEGNYQEMVEKSRKQYREVGNTYLTAINYMIDAYYEGDFLAQCAYRQLELYYDDDSKMTLGAYFETQPGADALATIFLEGNTYAIKNIRALIGMGVSYNYDGKTYLEKVSDAAFKMEANPAAYIGEDFGQLAKNVGTSMTTFRDMLKEFKTYESELNYDDDEYTELEIKYAEHAALAEMFKATPYLGGKTLYDFCLDYSYDESALSSIFPLVEALNEGQKAISIAGNYYDAVRYSMSTLPEEFMNDEITALEETFANEPFSIYSGVDRSIFSGTFALTTDAYRTDVSTDKGFFESVYGLSEWKRWSLETGSGILGTGLFIWAIKRTKDAISNNDASKIYEAASAMRSNLDTAMNNYVNSTVLILKNHEWVSVDIKDLISQALSQCPAKDFTNLATNQNLYVEQINYAYYYIDKLDSVTKQGIQKVWQKTSNIVEGSFPGRKCGGYGYKDPMPAKAAATSVGSTVFTVALYAVGAAMMVYSAYSYGSAIHSYYNPEYDDIPVSMIDYVVNDNGERYIKYDAVTMAVMNDKKQYYPADLNAFEGQRWNAIYYTKSYEAGKPLLANFKVSNNNNSADKNYLPVHRFGEQKCYDLNKYNFSYIDKIYLSIAQSENQKSAVANVPNFVGSIWNNGFYFMAIGLGAIAGSMITAFTKNLKTIKKRSKN